MRIGIMQPYFFPYIGYFALINAVDIFVLYDDVSYIKGGWVNRNRIKIGNSSAFISVPVTKASANYLINQVEIINYAMFKIKFFRTIEMNYKRTPNFYLIMELLTEIFNKEYRSFSLLDEAAIAKVCDYLEIPTKILRSSSLSKNIELKSAEKVIHICKLLGGDFYINAIGGQNLYSKDQFSQEKIGLAFIKMQETTYPQGNGDFIANLSILDILMWNSLEEVKAMLARFILV